MVKKLTSLVTIFCMVCTLSSCGAPGESVTEEPFTTLVVAVRSGERNNLQNIADGFETENPGIKLKFIELSSDSEQYRLISSAFSTEEYLFDVVEIEDVWVDDFVEKGYILPLSENLRPDETYLAYVKDSFCRNGNVYAMPFQIDLGMLFALKRYGWDGDFSSIVQLTDESDESILGIYDNDREEMVCSLMELIQYMDHDVEGALELYRNIYRSENSDRLYVEAFKKGEIPIMRAWSSVIPDLRGESSNVMGEFQIYNTPRGNNGQETSTAKIFGFAISKFSNQRENCEKFISYCSRNDIQVDWCKKTGVYPVRKNQYHDIGIASQWDHIPSMEQRILQAQVRPHMPEYEERVSELKLYVKEFLEGALSAEDAAIKVQGFLNL